MSVRLSRSLPLPPRSSSSFRMDEDVREAEKAGIVTVLGCDPGTSRAASLRRTLSADMSSKKWLAENGFRPLKETASSVSIEDSSSSDDEEDTLRKDVEGCGGQVYIWKARKDPEPEKPGETWSSILFQKVEDSKSLPPPYVHPLVKRSKSCLSTWSLEICTESLGSETGSDGFSSYPASEVGDMEPEEGHEEQHHQDKISSRAAAFDDEEFYVPKYNYTTAARKTRPQSFPPPIQSLSTGNRGGCLSMHSCRDNGRLVLKAVSIPSERNFEARREEGRLVLTFANNEESYQDDEEEDMDEEEEDELVMEMDEDISNKEEETEEGVDKEFVSECVPKLSSGGAMINIHKLAKLLNKPITTLNRNPDWQGKYDGAFDDGKDKEEDPILLEQSLPLKSPVGRMLSLAQSVPSTATAPASLNAYEYFWRKKEPANTFIASIGQPLLTLKGLGLNISVYANNLPLNKAHGYQAPLLQSCNSPSRTNLLWEPKCITTS